MPKSKTRSAVKKRYRKTAGGHLKYKKPYARHILSKKNRKRKRHLRKQGIVHATREKQLKTMLHN
ncbi:MAG: 50S ribosomal protein L35 [Chitinivibrionales bacterium]|nr:50S ribosomal protein L35 [Chitinivibrionales bacterium]